MSDYESTDTILEQQTDGTTEASQPEVAQGTESTQSQQPVEDWDGTKFALKFRGKEVVPESRDKLIMWAQQGYNAENRFAQLKQDQETLEAQRKDLAQYQQLSEAFNQNPVFKQKIFDLYYQTQGQGNGQEQSQEYGEVHPALAKQMQEMQSQLSEYQQQMANDALEKESQQLISKYPNFDWKTMDEDGKTLIHEVYAAAHKLGGVPLEVAFRHAAWDIMQEHAKAQALESQKQERVQASKRGKPVGSPQGAPQAKAPAANISNMSYDEIARHAISESLSR